MGHVGPISNDEWDRWEPLVGGLPFCLRIIVFHQFLMAMLAPFFIWPSVLAPLLGTWDILALLSLVAVSVWYFVSVLGACRLSRWALISLALINLFFSLCCFGRPLLDSFEFGELAEPAVIFVVVFLGVFPLLEGLYLLRLEAWVVRRHPRRQAMGGTDSPKACP
ncbi:MAG: hypothetical protein KAX80_09095 [Planctomycetes bacterium]|nr:hypothetical protein [Planctomycetota bacterium]